MRTVCLTIAIALGAGGLGAQTVLVGTGSGAVMRGAVEQENGRRIDGAEIAILGLNRTVTTRANGEYRIDSIAPGKYWVVVRRIGYAPLRAALSFQRGQDREIVFQLETLAQALPELSVKGEDERWNRRHQDFLWRSKVSNGYFLTRDDLERFGGEYLNHVVRRYVPMFSNLGFGRAASPASGWGRGALGWSMDTWGGMGGCSPAVSINGGRPMGWGLSDFRAEDVEAVEIYRSVRQMPIEFEHWGLGCGLVVVWTG